MWRTPYASAWQRRGVIITYEKRRQSGNHGGVMAADRPLRCCIAYGAGDYQARKTAARAASAYRGMAYRIAGVKSRENSGKRHHRAT